MILVDANLLIYASFDVYSEHAAARDWLDRQLNQSDKVGLPWTTLLAFLRVSTNPRILQRPLSMAVAWNQVVEWLGCEPVWIPEPTSRHSEIVAPLLLLPGIRGNLVTGAHLAALAIEHGLTLHSNDGDFARFPKLRWQNPLAA